mgnify:CR=1 FL=1
MVRLFMLNQPNQGLKLTGCVGPNEQYLSYLIPISFFFENLTIYTILIFLKEILKYFQLNGNFMRYRDRCERRMTTERVIWLCECPTAEKSLHSFWYCLLTFNLSPIRKFFWSAKVSGLSLR